MLTTKVSDPVRPEEDNHLPNICIETVLLETISKKLLEANNLKIYL